MADVAVSPETGCGRAVYGLRVRGLDDVPALDQAIPGADCSALLDVHVRRTGSPPPPLSGLDGDRWVRPLPCGRTLHLHRPVRRATFHGEPLTPDLLAHPYLGPVAAGFNRWAGREVFHASAFVVDRHAWIVVGSRTAGKSTLAAGLAASGIPVLADDLAVTDGQWVYAGPRTVDLRERLPAGLFAGAAVAAAPASARSGTRWRLPLPPTLPRWPLGGWIFLQWGAGPALTTVPAATTLARIARWRSLPALPSDPTRILALSTLPAWDLHRPKSWADLPRTVDLLQRELHGRSPATTATPTLGYR